LSDEWRLGMEDWYSLDACGYILNVFNNMVKAMLRGKKKNL